MSAVQHSVAPYPPAGAAAFLPLTLSAVRSRPPLGPLTKHVWAAEHAAEASWQALLGGCSCVRRRDFPESVRLLSAASAAYAGPGWWSGPGRRHRDRVTSFQVWAEDALAEGDGAEFAEACAGYDAALAGALVAAPTVSGTMVG